MNLRPYQQSCLENAIRDFDECNRLLAVLPTGGGKTVIFSHLARHFANDGQRVLILAHREELIEQAIAKLFAATGLVADKEKAEFSASLDAPVVVASIQTMIRRLDKWPADHFQLIICDEAHHVLSDQWQSVLRHFRNAKVLGVTATPDRGDKRNLGQFFDKVTFEIGLFDLVDQGFLCPIAVQSIPLKIDLSSVKSEFDPESGCQDFSKRGVADALEPYLSELAVHILTRTAFRRGLGFVPLIDTAKKMAQACRDAGINAEYIYGEDPDRKSKLDRFRNWEFDWLWNSGLLAEGYDDPGIDCICPLRVTRSRPLYTQWVGRGTRIHPGKTNLLLLDFLWMHERHSIVHPAHLIARTEEEADEITTQIEAHAGIPAALADEMEMNLQDAVRLCDNAQEEKLRRELDEKAIREAVALSPRQFAQIEGSLDLFNYEPTMKSDFEPISDKQVKWLEKVRVDVGSKKIFLGRGPKDSKPLDLSRIENKGQASAILAVAFDKSKRGVMMASSAQKWKMRQMGYPNWEHATEQEARQFFADQNRARKEPSLI